MIKKKKIVIIFIFLAVLVGFDTFQHTKIGVNTKALALVFGTLGYGLFAFYFRRFPKILRFFGITLLLLMLQSIQSTYYIHKQPVNLSFLANASIFNSGLAFFVYYLILKYKITLAEIKQFLLRTAWVLVLAMIIVHFLQINILVDDTIPGDFQLSMLRKGFVTMAGIIYLTDFFKTNKSKYIAFSLLFIATDHLAEFQRGAIFLYLLSILILLFHYRRNSSFYKLTLAITLSIPLILIASITTDFGSIVSQKISDAFELLESDRDSYSESSIEIRVIQSEYAISQIRIHPVTGIGQIHHSLKEKYTGLSYFYQNDIGLIGIILTFGIFGILIMIRQFGYLIHQFRRGQFKTIPNIIEYKTYLFVIMIQSIMSGASLFRPGEFMIVLVFISLGIQAFNAEKDLEPLNSTPA
ncbi:MAG: hypothetical protein HRT57_16845 [Crocinitomicaceae bacterium]|nr:hypothetical protein [Crocinitomicaceae bacterium]